ncbi:MAG: hypothetical protein Q8O99_06640 [bacterium]|nr:hypothetical protein [bacterium]
MQLENLTNEPISTDDLVLVRDSSTHKLPEQITLPPHQTTTMVGNL